jgi:hypothetical protein
MSRDYGQRTQNDTGQAGAEPEFNRGRSEWDNRKAQGHHKHTTTPNAGHSSGSLRHQRPDGVHQIVAVIAHSHGQDIRVLDRAVECVLPRTGVRLVNESKLG